MRGYKRGETKRTKGKEDNKRERKGGLGKRQNKRVR